MGALYPFDKFTSMNATTVLVTGASSGIGLACVMQFLQRGANVIGWSRRPVEVPEHLGGRFIHQHVDVRSHDAVKHAVEQLHRGTTAQGRPWSEIDILVNNAGLSRGLNPLHEGVDEDWEEMIDTNLKGLLWVTREILPGMVERHRGTIVNIASVAGIEAYRGGNVYCATKAAVKMLSDTMQIDLLGSGVRVCNVDPGMVHTEFSQVRYRGDMERAARVYQGLTPLSGDDVADVVVFAATRPQHVTLQDILIMPTDQATIHHVNKKV